MLLLAALACAPTPFPLEDVAVTGEVTPALERAVHDALRDQAQDYAEWPLDLREVRLMAGPERWEAAWRPAARRVDLGVAWFSDTVNGEDILQLAVCDAMHDQLDLGLATDKDFPPADPDAVDLRASRMDLFRLLCVYGRPLADAYVAGAEGCGQPELALAARRVLQDLFEAPPDVLPAADIAPELGRLTLADGEDLLDLAVRSPEVLAIAVNEVTVFGLHADGYAIEDPGVVTDRVAMRGLGAEVWRDGLTMQTLPGARPARLVHGVVTPAPRTWAAAMLDDGARLQAATGVCADRLLAAPSEGGWWVVGQDGRDLVWWRVPIDTSGLTGPDLP